MARQHGQRASYPAQMRNRYVRTGVAAALVTEFVLGGAVGLAVGTLYLRLPLSPAGTTLLIMVVCTFMLALGWGVLRWLSRSERQLWNYVEGAAGEERIAAELSQLPDSFHVIHGICTPNGDVDHLVIGPTGVYVLDTKKWQGVVTANPAGELLWNGRRYKDHVAALQRTVMVLRDMLLTPGGAEPFFQAAFVFVGCTVNISPGQLGRCDALTPDQLLPYLQRTTGRRGLDAPVIDDLVSRALGHLK